MKHSKSILALFAIGLLATSLLPAPASAARSKADELIAAAAKSKDTDTGAHLSLKERLALLEAKNADPEETATAEDNKTEAKVAKDTKDTKDTKAKKDKKEKKKKAPKQRFQQILQDDSYIYYMDTQNVRWISMPHSGGEKIIDVWIRLVDKGAAEDASTSASASTSTGDASYTYPAKYFLEHYYIRPEKQQIQFLSELEVTGRPQNTVQERAYNAQNWEELVPESVEDSIYHAVVDRMKSKSKTGGIFPEGMSVRDAVEEYFRISL